MEPALADNIPQRVAAGIAIGRRVGHLADPDTIKHDPDYPREHQFRA
jgi:hypothetical protein